MPGSLGGKTTVGKLRQRVRIEAAGETLDDYRAPVQTWAEEATVWADVTLVKGDEIEQAGRVQEVSTYSVVTRYRPGLTSKKRLVWLITEPLTLNIVTVLPMEGNRNFVECFCRVAEAVE